MTAPHLVRPHVRRCRTTAADVMAGCLLYLLVFQLAWAGFKLQGTGWPESWQGFKDQQRRTTDCRLLGRRQRGSEREKEADTD